MKFIINDVEEELIEIQEYTYTSTGTFYYNVHYNFPRHNRKVYE